MDVVVKCERLLAVLVAIKRILEMLFVFSAYKFMFHEAAAASNVLVCFPFISKSTHADSINTKQRWRWSMKCKRASKSRELTIFAVVLFVARISNAHRERKVFAPRLLAGIAFWQGNSSTQCNTHSLDCLLIFTILLRKCATQFLLPFFPPPSGLAQATSKNSPVLFNSIQFCSILFYYYYYILVSPFWIPTFSSSLSQQSFPHQVVNFKTATTEFTNQR